MVEEATVDAYDESEQVCGFYTMLENDLELPFNTAVLGGEVVVERIDLTDAILLWCAGAVKSGRGYPFWSFPCQTLRQRDGSGSRRTATGRGSKSLNHVQDSLPSQRKA